MGRLSIESLPKVAKRFRPSSQLSDFETKAKTRKEDGSRQKSIRNLRYRLSRVECSVSKQELDELEAAIRDRKSGASARYMRPLRNKLAGHIYKLVERDPKLAFTATLIPRQWEFRGGELDRANPKAMLNGLRSAINRAGFDGSKGWLIAGIHGEHEPTSDAHVLHLHAVGSGSARATIDALRKSWCFKSGTGDAGKVNVKRRIRLSRKPLTGLPSPLTYVLQSYWPEKPIFEASDGHDMRWWHKRRIEEPRHAEVLHWLHRNRPRDIVLLMGVYVGAKGLELTKERTPKGGEHD